MYIGVFLYTAAEKIKRPLQNDQFLWFYYLLVSVWVKFTFLFYSINYWQHFYQISNKNIVRSVKVWMKDHHIRTLSWLAQSPDLNPIKNLWNVIKRKMEGHKPSNKAELLEFLRQEWHKVTQRQCERLVESMPRRMKAVIVNQGCSIKYWFLNSS